MTAVPEGGRVHTVNEPSTEQSKDSIASSGASEVDGFGSQEGILPSDVRSRILSAVSEGGSNSDFAQACQEYEFLKSKELRTVGNLRLI